MATATSSTASQLMPIVDNNTHSNKRRPNIQIVREKLVKTAEDVIERVPATIRNCNLQLQINKARLELQKISRAKIEKDLHNIDRRINSVKRKIKEYEEHISLCKKQKVAAQKILDDSHIPTEADNLG